MPLVNKFATMTTNSNSAAFTLDGLGRYKVSTFVDEGDVWDTSTLKLQSTFDGGTTWVDVAGSSWTAGDGRLEAEENVYGDQIRYNLASVGGTTSLTPLAVAKPVSRMGIPKSGLYTANVAGAAAEEFILPNRTGIAFAADGTWGSGTLTLEYSVDGGTTWYDAVVLTADGMTPFAPYTATNFRVILEGATTPSIAWKVVA